MNVFYVLVYYTLHKLVFITNRKKKIKGKKRDTVTEYMKDYTFLWKTFQH